MPIKSRKRNRATRRGLLTFEWILLLTLLTLGVIAGVSAVRDALVSEMGDVAEAAVSFDQSYTLAEHEVRDSSGAVIFTIPASSFTDTKPTITIERDGPAGQLSELDDDS
ncbi:MAG: hypothetical protein MPJ24_02390 [Pirellulaceae bacterium]|nr:hypothetical protein [Pirellulaceae bacterium]